jgi:hypothetical protein
MAKKPWTVMIYMVADDPTGSEPFDQLTHQELDRIVQGAPSVDGKRSVHVAMQVDFRTQPFVWRRVVGQGTWLQPESNAADPATLYGFFRFVHDKCPAEKYLLILWGHSRGPFGLFKDDDAWVYVAQSLTLNELRLALTEATRLLGKPIDIVAFKDCFMGTLETACELPGLVDFMVASQGLVPIERWPYKKIFAALTPGQDSAHTREAARTIARALERHYDVPVNRADNDVVPYSVLDIGRVDDARQRLGDLVARLEAEYPNNARTAVLQLEGVAPADRALLDARTLCDRLIALGHADRKPALSEASTAFDQALAELVVFRSADDPFRGLSLFCCPAAPEATKESLVALNGQREVYERLSLNTLNEDPAKRWSRIALPPKVTAIPGLEAAMVAQAPQNAHAFVPWVMLQLQRQGVLERFQLDAMQFARSAISALASPVNFGEKPANFSDKPANFADKPANFFS